MNKIAKLLDGSYCRGLSDSEYVRIFHEYCNFYDLFSGNCYIIRNISKRKFVIKAFVGNKCCDDSLFFLDEVSTVKKLGESLTKACTLYQNTFLPSLEKKNK